MSKENSDNNLMNYEFFTKDGKKVTVCYEDSDENPSFLMQGPKELIQNIVGGLGEENETEAWVTHKELKTEAKRMFAVLELMRLINE